MQPARRTCHSQDGGPRRLAAEAGGALGDLGTFLPHAIGAMTVAGLAPAGVLFGFGSFLVASGLFYRLPMAVQPMKAVSAVMLIGGLSTAEVAATGMAIGVLLLALGLSGAIGWAARLIPKSVTAGLQLGLGLSMAALGIGLLLERPAAGVLALAALLVLMRLGRFPAAPGMIILSVAAAMAVGDVAFPAGLAPGWSLPTPVLPSPADFVRALELGVLPQMPLTLTNAVVVTALICRELYPERAGRAGERNLAVSSGLANLLLAPLGAMPMCHGAGGVQAQHRFGARSGVAPILFGALLLVLALFFAKDAAALFAVIPAGAVGALLVVAGGDLALSRRLFDARPNCWPAIGATALATLVFDPAVGLAAGWSIELGRAALRRQAEQPTRGE